jgi:hypothetical protein
VSPLETVIEPAWPWPVWTAVIGALLLLAAAWQLYRLEPSEIGRRMRTGLILARLLICLLLIWMLAGWQRQQYRTEPVQLIVAVDDSVSMSFADEYQDTRAAARRASLLGGESTKSDELETPADRFQIARSLLEHPRLGWLESWRQDYLVKLRLVGATVREVAVGSPDPLADRQPLEPASRLGQGVRELLEAQQGIPTAAIVLLTDGVNTAGPALSEAAESAKRQGIPLFAVGMGGGQVPRDLRLADLICDDVVLAGDSVQLAVQLIADSLAGTKAKVRLRRAESADVLSEQQVAIETNAVRVPVRLSFRPPAAGTLPLTVEVEAVPGESDTANNRLEHSLQVDDVAIKILLVQAYPSYEYRYLKNLLSRATRPSDASAKAFDLTTVLQDADREHAAQDPAAAQLFPVKREDLNEFDVVVFGDVDPKLLGRTAMDNLVSFVRDLGGSIVFVSGPRFTPAAYRDTPLAQLFPFAVGQTTAPTAFPVSESFTARLTPIGASSPACQLADLQSDNAAVWNSLPTLYWFWEIPGSNPGARVLLEHPTKTGDDGRPLPLILNHYVGSGSVVFHATDETYRWSRFQGNDEYYSRYWLQTLRSLSRTKLQSGLSPAELTTDRQRYIAGEDVHLRVRFRQERPDLEQVTVAIEQPGGARHTVSLPRSAPNQPIFTASVPERIPGDYRVTLISPLVEPAAHSRTFTVTMPAQEPVGVPRNTDELQKAARISGGRYYDWFQADRIVRDLPRGVRVRVESLPAEPIWNSSLVAGLFVAMLTGEWLLRRRAGML